MQLVSERETRDKTSDWIVGESDCKSDLSLSVDSFPANRLIAPIHGLDSNTFISLRFPYHYPEVNMPSRLSAARYGKDNVRVYKVHRNPETGVQTVYEMTVCVLLEGEIGES